MSDRGPRQGYVRLDRLRDMLEAWRKDVARCETVVEENRHTGEQFEWTQGFGEGRERSIDEVESLIEAERDEAGQ